ILPAPPPTFSMMTGWPSDARRRSAKIRASVSVGPPGGYGTIMVIGRDGKGWAVALAIASAMAQIVAEKSLTISTDLFLLRSGDRFRDRLPDLLLLLDEG